MLAATTVDGPTVLFVIVAILIGIAALIYIVRH